MGNKSDKQMDAMADLANRGGRGVMTTDDAKITEEEIEIWDELCRLASPGPWVVHELGKDDVTVCKDNGDGTCHIVADCDECNALFIATAKTAIPMLIARVRELEEIVSRLPRTADGVPVVPGMTMWAVGGIANLKEVRCNDEAHAIYFYQSDGPDGLINDYVLVEYERCYSEKSAAEAAIKENLK